MGERMTAVETRLAGTERLDEKQDARLDNMDLRLHEKEKVQVKNMAILGTTIAVWNLIFLALFTGKLKAMFGG